MAHTIQNLPLQAEFGKTALRFYTHRLARIYAGWWPFFVIYCIAWVVLGSRNEKNLLNSFFLIPQSLNLNLLPITWTLSFELYFYTVLGILLLFPRRFLQPAVLASGLFVAISTIYFFITDLYQPRRFSVVTILHEFFLFPLILEFAAGFLIFHFVAKHKSAQAWWPWAMSALGLGVAAIYYQLHADLLHPSGLAGFHHAPQRVLLVGGASVCLVAFALIAPAAKGSLVNLTAKLGDASYSMYLGHIAVLSVFSLLANRVTLFQKFPLTYYGAAIVAVLVYSWVHYSLVERPLYRWMKRRLA